MLLQKIEVDYTMVRKKKSVDQITGSDVKNHNSAEALKKLVTKFEELLVKNSKIPVKEGETQPQLQNSGQFAKMQEPCFWNKLLIDALPIGKTQLFAVIGTDLEMDDMMRALILDKLDSKFDAFIGNGEIEERSELSLPEYEEIMTAIFDDSNVTVQNEDDWIDDMQRRIDPKNVVNFQGVGQGQKNKSFKEKIDAREKARLAKIAQMPKDDSGIDYSELGGDKER